MTLSHRYSVSNGLKKRGAAFIVKVIEFGTFFSERTTFVRNIRRQMGVVSE
jgi:hypothetical protein